MFNLKGLMVVAPVMSEDINRKISTIKILRQMNQNLTLLQAKHLIDDNPEVVDNPIKLWDLFESIRYYK